MNRLIYSLALAVMASGSALAAGDALSGLASSVSPSVLENSIQAAPVPVPAEAAPATPLTAETLKGEYAIRPYGFAMLQMTLADEVTIIRKDPAGDVVCKGVYELAAGPALTASFINCGGNDFSLKINLAGQTIETLSAGVNVIGSGKLGEDAIPMLPIKLQKIK